MFFEGVDFDKDFYPDAYDNNNVLNCGFLNQHVFKYNYKNYQFLILEIQSFNIFKKIQIFPGFLFNLNILIIIRI